MTGHDNGISARRQRPQRGPLGLVLVHGGAFGRAVRETQGLRRAGALASARASVVGALSTLAHCLRPLRAGVLGLL
ncbi:hypothetical protein OHQ89_00670 [Streptomyces canus]|uniref:hypothetical protein n=1 Tax=Streptomyces canus TaxID=58343 RepID=UPI002E2A8A69|nr:hypothetical protein [Streptomyces canus]